MAENTAQKIATRDYKKRKTNPMERGKLWFIIPMLTVPVLNFLIFWLYVNFESFLNAFRIEEYGEIKFSLINWEFMWKDLLGANLNANLGALLKNTLLYFSAGMFVVLPLSLVLAYFLYKKIRFYKYYRVIFFLPNIISGAVLATLYKFMLNPSVGGIIPKIMEFFSGSPAKNLLLDEKWAKWLVVLYSVWTGFSVNLIIFNGAMERVPKEVIEASELDGVTMMQEFIYILFPMMWATLSTIIVTNVANIFTASGAVLLLTGGDMDTASISYWIYITTKNELSIYYPSTVAMCCTLIAFPIVLIVKRLTEKVFPDIYY